MTLRNLVTCAYRSGQAVVLTAAAASLAGGTAHGHAGHHEGESLVVNLLHWLWEPDHLLVLGVAIAAVNVGYRRYVKSKRTSA